MVRLSFDAVVFDMDGVLVDSESIHLRAYQHVFAPLGVELTAARYHQLFGRARDQVIQDVLGPCAPEVLDRLMREKGRAVEGLIGAGVIPAIPGALDTVRALVAAGVPLAVATSSRSPRVFLEGLGVFAYFRHVVDRTMVTRPKPDPEAYARVVGLLGVPAERCVVIEDSPSGVRAAKGAGAAVIGLATTHEPDALWQADVVARDHADVRAMLGVAG
jgi:HAD superfamily hydrolase (TIGR01509 family)